MTSETGQSVASLPLLLLPGLMCDQHVWSEQLAAFPQAMGISGYGDARSLQEMARRTLAAAPERFALAGHSMGARVALEVFRLAPERVERLALFSSGTHLPRPREAEKRHALLSLGRKRGIEALVDAWLPPMLTPAHSADEALMAPLRAMCVAEGVDRYEAQITALLNRPELDSLLPTIACPVLIGVGREDAWAPVEQHEAMAQLIPDAELEIFEDAGHFAPVEAPAAINAALRRWLTR